MSKFILENPKNIRDFFSITAARRSHIDSVEKVVIKLYL